MAVAAPPTRPVVFVCLVFHPDSSASSILFTDLFVRLAESGERVTALTGFPTKDDPALVSALPRRESYNGVEIVRCGLRLPGKRGLGSRFLAYGSFLVHAAWYLARYFRHARIVGGTDPPFTSAALWLLSRFVRLNYETILLDAYPDGLIALGTLQERSALVRVWRAVNARAYRGARHIIVIGRDMISLLHDRYGVDRRRVTYIPHWGPKEAEGIPGERGPLLARLGLDRKFVVQYSGNMGLWHDMEALIRVAERLQDDDGVHFLFIGKGRRRDAAENLARDLNLTNITWHDFAPREELAATLASCDAALISLRAGMEGVAVPSKLYGIMAAGRPVLAMVPPDSEVGQAVHEEGCGYVVPSGDVDGMVRAIRKLAETPAVAEEMGRRARAAYDAKYTIDHAANAYRRLWTSPDRDELRD